MSFMEGATDVAIFGGTYVIAAAGSAVAVNNGGQPGPSNAFKDLSAAVAHKALHDSAARINAPRCHQSTRTKYLDGFERWMLGEQGELYGKRLIWLNGGAGAGKSAIMQTIIERCAYRAIILGAFFFSRVDSSRNYLEVLIPTLAYQVARSFPAAMAVLEPIILGDPLIFTASPYTQAYQLLVRPLLYLIEARILNSTNALQGVFVIDGLDECSNPQKQTLLIHIIASILRDYDIPIGFLIASRPELEIACAFQRAEQLLASFASVSLHNDEDAESDIRRFIEDSFLDILDSHPWRMNLTFPWPSSRSVNLLVQRSSGHFVFASTVMKFIASSSEHPARALEVVEGIVPSRTGSPFGELDALYMHILTQARYSAQVIDILKHCYFTEFPRSIAAVSHIHDIPLEDIKLFLSDVQSLISLVPSSSAELIITPIHASLRDFLTSKDRSQALYIERGTYHASHLARYFQLVDSGPCTSASSFSFRGDTTNYLITVLAKSITNSEDTKLCLSLIERHSCYDIWDFCVESSALDTTSSRVTRKLAAESIYGYMDAIRKFSITTDNKSLFLHQFALHMEMIMSDLTELAHRKPQYRIIPAMIFSSSHAGLYWGFYLLWRWGRTLGIDSSCEYLFFDAEQDVTDKEANLSFEAIRCSPFSKLSWGRDLALLMKLVLEQLANLSQPSNMPYTTPHKRWLRKNKPLKQISLGLPRLSSAIFSNLFRSTRPDERFAKTPYHTDWRHSGMLIWYYWHGAKIYWKKLKCLTLLKAVVFYLRYSDCTREVVDLARRSLPLAAQWYPKLMKRTRAEMDAYIHRWQGGATSPMLNARLLNHNSVGRYQSSVRYQDHRARYHYKLRNFVVELSLGTRLLPDSRARALWRV